VEGAGPAGTPAPILDRVAAVPDGFATPEIRKRLRTFRIEPAPQDGAAFARFLDAECRRWGDVVREAKIRLD
jgi:tripartite-type tricarboxylate transporter receptor subunit TctC